MRTVAVFSEADRGARHVREADDAILIGAAAPQRSYLCIEALLQAANTSAVQAIHPGYGFLSENAEFAEACRQAGFIFVGPPGAAIAAMGSKLAARTRMRAAGVPILPGYDGVQQDLAHLEREGRALGLPLIIKPAAGGGGKGMRIVHAESELPGALAAARRFAETNWRDGSLLLERFLAAPRHVEVQVFADSHGHVLHLGDRDCSIQRRNQKLLEEAPAPHIPVDVRQRLHDTALRVAREVGYVNAGTVEFLMDGREFYFMEMNTRLQVEHPVTEAVTGLDLVEWQLRVASGEPLLRGQGQIRLQGHAVEARVCAEDPEQGFLPSPGDIRQLSWPSGEGVRVDAGVESGDTVPPYYDSLLGKVVSWAPQRREAALRLGSALESLNCEGISCNAQWLARVVRSPEFLNVQHSTAWLEQHAAKLGRPRQPVESDG